MKCTFAYSQLDHQDIKMNAAVGGLARYNTQKNGILEATIHLTEAKYEHYR